MKKRPFIKLFFSLLLILVIMTVSGCEFLGVEDSDDFTAWTHTIVAGNYTAMSGYAVYRITDDRFNTDDWYDVWMDDSFWDSALGWSSFESVYESGRFYFEPEYYDGYIEWNAYSDTDIVGATLRFYRRKHP